MIQSHYEHSPRRCERRIVEFVAARGYLDILEFIIAHQTHDVRTFAINAAARHSCLEIVKHLMERYEDELELATVINCTTAFSDHLDVVTFLHEHHFKNGGGCIPQTIRDPAVCGHLDVVKFLYENRTEGWTPDALELAVQKGLLEIARFLHTKYAFNCPTEAMDNVARKGRLKILVYLYKSGAGCCSEWAIAGAALRGHFGVVQFLHAQRTVKERTRNYELECGVDNSHFGREVVRYLSDIATEDGDINAFLLTVRYGCLHVVTFLLKHIADDYVMHALRSAAKTGDLEAVKVLHRHLKANQSAYPALMAMAEPLVRINYRVVQFFCDNQKRKSMKSFLKQAVVNGATALAKAILDRMRILITKDELVEALELAVEHGQQ